MLHITPFYCACTKCFDPSFFPSIDFIDEYERTLLGTTHEEGAQQQPPSPSFGLLTAEAVASLGERSAFRGDQAAVFVRAEYDFSSDVPGDLCFKVRTVCTVTQRDALGARS